MIESFGLFAAGLLIGLLIGLLCARVAYAYGRYRGQNEARWAGYDMAAKAKRKE